MKEKTRELDQIFLKSKTLQDAIAPVIDYYEITTTSDSTKNPKNKTNQIALHSLAVSSRK